jgi:Gluconate 2-dehydrogenase subunit 3
MRSVNDVRILRNDADRARVSRRELAQILLNGLAAGIVSPFSSAIDPIRRHLLNGSFLDFADAHLSDETRKPLFLSAQQLATLGVLSEAIVPGSRKAEAAHFIDLLLSVETDEVEKTFLKSLSAIEAQSQNAYKTSIIALNPNQLHDLLTKLAEADSPAHKDFNNLKNWTVGAYYSSEIGMRELGWTPDRVFSDFPGCSHPDGHA